MSFSRSHRPQGGTVVHEDYQWSSLSRNSFIGNGNNRTRIKNVDGTLPRSFFQYLANSRNAQNDPTRFRDYTHHDISQNYNSSDSGNVNYSNSNSDNNYRSENGPSWKRRKFTDSTWVDSGRGYARSNPAVERVPVQPNWAFPAPPVMVSGSCKRPRSKLEDEEPVFLSRDEIERQSPSRKDGIDALRETHLRYSYCAFLQSLGLRLELPQTTIGTAMVLCHRFFIRRSHACHDRFLIATAALFLSAKSEETPRPLNNVLRASSELYHKQDMSVLSYMFPIDWFEQYRERVIEAENMILTTLNFELNVHHPYAPLTSTINKLGLSQAVLVVALNLVSEGLRSSLWLQFKPHHIAAGAAYLAGKFLHMDLGSHQNIWQEFQATPAILHDVAQQLMELL